jgi:spore maturation protein CgeB
MAGTRKITAMAGSVSGGGSIGRTEVADLYVESLLTTKIVVVAQRDNWEDHYRLFEAFVGGAMVMTDLMISLPEGLIDGDNIVMYRSKDNLRELLLHYLNPKQDEVRLAIARKGYEVAMEQHRSYHRMEEVFYGKRLSS